MRRAAKIDTTQPAIVDALLAAGCKVQSLACVGFGVPDLLCASPHGTLHLIECKSPGGGLTWQQEKWRQSWGWPVHIVETPEDALRVIGHGGLA